MEDNRSAETGETNAPTENDNATFSRRSYLRGLGAAGLAGGLLQRGVLTDAAAACDPSQYYDRFDTVVDVTDAGADNTGRESVSSVLQEHLGDDTLLVFPPGRYYMDEQVRFTGFDNVGLVGNNATLVPADFHDFEGPQYRLFRLGTHYSPGTDLLIKGFGVDLTAPDTGIRAFDAVVDDGLHVEDVAVYGRHDSGTTGPGRFNVVDPDGSGVVERFIALDGGQWESETPNAGDLWRGPTGILANMTKGTLRFVDCELGGFPDNGLYASGDTGEIIVDGGVYKNSNGNSVRVGGNGGLVRGVTVEIDETPSNFNVQRGIRLQRAENVRIEDSSVTITTPEGAATGLFVDDTCGETWTEGLDVTVDTPVATRGITVSGDAGFATLYKSTVEINGPGGFGIHLRDGDSSDGANVEAVDVVGDAGDDSARAGIRCDRDNCRFGAVTVDQPGGSKRRAVVNTGDDVTIYKGEYRASNYPIIDLGTGTHVAEIYAESYGDLEAIRLYDQSADVYLKNNVLPGGVRDDGSAGLKMVGNEF